MLRCRSLSFGSKETRQKGTRRPLPSLKAFLLPEKASLSTVQRSSTIIPAMMESCRPQTNILALSQSQPLQTVLPSFRPSYRRGGFQPEQTISSYTLVHDEKEKSTKANSPVSNISHSLSRFLTTPSLSFHHKIPSLSALPTFSAAKKASSL